MKKIGILIIVLILVCLLTACNNSSVKSAINVGKYYSQEVFGSESALEYLNNIDDEKYEIVSISQVNDKYTIFYKEIDTE